MTTCLPSVRGRSGYNGKTKAIAPAAQTKRLAELAELATACRAQGLTLPVLVRFTDILRLTLPPSLVDSPYASFFTGMFLAQCKTIRDRRIAEVITAPITVSVGAPLAEAVHVMVVNRLVSLPVVDGERLVGVLRDRAVVLELSRWMAV